MNVDIKVDRDFENAMKELEVKYGEDFMTLNGFHPSQLNMSDFIDGFIDKNVADATIDSNANASTKDVRSLLSEKGKSLDKLFCFNKWFIEMKKKYGLATAKEWLESEFNGLFYMHDAHTSSYMGYCYAFDITRLAHEGLFFLNEYNHQPPKHLTTFLDDVIEYVSYMSNRSSGAVGLPNLLIWTYYFWKKDCESGYHILTPDYYIRQCFQKLIYRLNQPFLRTDQSSFVNVSIFDREYIKSLFGGLIYPDETLAIDCVEELIEHQKVFMEVVSDIRNSSVFAFPVLTYSLLYKNGKFVDEDFARWCSDHNVKWNDSNFFISGDVSTLSNCCFDGSQMVLTKSSEGVHYMSFRDLYKSGYKHNFTIFHDGSWTRGKLVRLPKKEMFRVRTSNNKEILVTCDHINPTLRGDVRTDRLREGDYLLFNTSQLDVVSEVDKHLTYEHGLLIGMYIGDGSMHRKEESNSTTTVSLSLNKEKYESSIKSITSACKSIDSSATVKLNKPYNNVYPVVIRNDAVANFIRSFVSGNYCFEKSLNMDCLLQSADFRRGILDGYYLTDGGNSNRIYTTSRDMVGCMEALITSLGMNSIINVSDRTGEGNVVIRGQQFNRNYPLYCIRWYGSCNRRRLKDVYIKRLGGMYFKVVAIERYDTDDEYVYCFEMDNEDEPYFTLPNGVVTHNCRLLSDTSKLNAFINSIGGTALSIGSVKVNTINLMRIAYESQFDADRYIELLRRDVELCCKILDVQRHVIQRNIEKGLLPNYQDGGVELDKQYSTVGILGLYEVIEAFGLTTTDEFGYVYYTDAGVEFASRIFETINQVKDSFNDEYSRNVESVPAERAAVILCQKDNLLYGKKEKFIYSNQWIPLSAKCTISEKLRLSSILDAKCSGGAIAHINLESNFPNNDVAWEMLNKVAQSGVIYFAFNTKINECKNHHGFVGTDTCPHCGEPVFDTLQRIVGYIRPSRSYSKDRLREFNTRRWYDFASMMND